MVRMSVGDEKAKEVFDNTLYSNAKGPMEWGVLAGRKGRNDSRAAALPSDALSLFSFSGIGSYDLDRNSV